MNKPTLLYFFIALFIIQHLTFNISHSQTPQAFKYQAVVRDSTGVLISNQTISIRAAIVADSANGTTVYQETHSVNSNEFGLISLQIGSGTPVSGTFNAIDWSTGFYFTKIEMDEAGGSNYQTLSEAEMLSVPYALYAENAGNDAVDDADADPANEIQDISLSGTDLSITSGSTVDLSVLQDGTTDADADPANELQAISVSNDTVFLSNGGHVKLPAGYILQDDDTDTKIQVEKTADEDVIRFDVGGSEQWLMQGVALETRNTDGSLFIGEGVGVSGVSNVFLGQEAGRVNTTSGRGNVAIGAQSLYSNTTGDYNTANGNEALYYNTTGSYNIAIGYRTLYYNTTGDYNTANGNQALYYNTVGSYNTASGDRALFYNTTGYDNTANGNQALYNNTTGLRNTANGYQTLRSNTTGSSNVAMGVKALYLNTDKSNLVAIGDSALYNNGAGATQSYHANGNTALGSKALYSNTTGYRNTANGYQALYSNTIGYRNTANGYQALYSNTTGYYNMANGNQTLYSNTTGNSNAANGTFSLAANTTGSKNAAGGYSCLGNNTTGDENTGLGYDAEVGTGNLSNATAIGARAQVDASNSMVLGSIAGVNGASSSVNVGIGTTAPGERLSVAGTIESTTGGFKFPDGSVLTSAVNAPSVDNLGNHTATQNIELNGNWLSGDGDNEGLRVTDDGDLGINAIYTNVTFNIRQRADNNRVMRLEKNNGDNILLVDSSGNIGISTTAPSSLLSLGSGAQANKLSLWDDGSSRIGMGIQSSEYVFFLNLPSSKYTFYDDNNLSTALMTITGIGNVGIGNVSPTQKLHVVGNICYTGSSTSCSDLRYKKDITILPNVLEKLEQINGVYYNWKVGEFPENEFSEERQIGVIAQELEQVYPELVITDANGYKTVDYPKLTAVLLEGLKAQSSTVQEVQVENQQIKAELEIIKAALNLDEQAGK